MYLTMVSSLVVDEGVHHLVDENGKSVDVTGELIQRVYRAFPDMSILFKALTWSNGAKEFELLVLEENGLILDRQDVKALCDKFSFGTLSEMKVNAPEFSDLFTPVVTYRENSFDDLSLEDFLAVEKALSSLALGCVGEIKFPDAVESRMREILDNNNSAMRANLNYNIDLWSAISEERIGRLTGQSAVKVLLHKIREEIASKNE